MKLFQKGVASLKCRDEAQGGLLLYLNFAVVHVLAEGSGLSMRTLITILIVLLIVRYSSTRRKKNDLPER